MTKRCFAGITFRSTRPGSQDRLLMAVGAFISNMRAIDADPKNRLQAQLAFIKVMRVPMPQSNITIDRRGKLIGRLLVKYGANMAELKNSVFKRKPRISESVENDVRNATYKPSGNHGRRAGHNLGDQDSGWDNVVRALEDGPSY